MLRFQLDRAIMVKRWRIEWEKHGRNFGNCHCGQGMGTMRKHKPFESHPSRTCRLCAWVRVGRNKERRSDRYQARREVANSADGVQS